MFKKMFLIENNVPDVYVDESKDFQLIARLYDLVLQSTRFSIDSMDNTSDALSCNNTILPLIGTKVGFFSESKLPDTKLRKILSAFPYIMKYKGSKQGIIMVLNLFERLTNTIVSMEDSTDPNRIRIRFHNYMINVELLYELIEYVRPTGMMVDVEFKRDVNNYSDYSFSDKVFINKVVNYADIDMNESSGAVVTKFVDNNIDSATPSNVGFTVVSTIYDNEDKGEN